MSPYVGLLEADDRRIWEFALAEGFSIVTTDGDFFELITTFGPPPKVVWLKNWQHPTRLLRRSVVLITDFAADADLGILVLTRDE